MKWITIFSLAFLSGCARQQQMAQTPTPVAQEGDISVVAAPESDTGFDVPALLNKSPTDLQSELGPGLSFNGDKTISGLAQITWTRGNVHLAVHYTQDSNKIHHFYLTSNDIRGGSEDVPRTLALGNLKSDARTPYRIEFDKGMGPSHVGVKIYPS